MIIVTNLDEDMLKLFQGGYLFLGGSTYLLVNKSWGSTYNYRGVPFSREHLLTITMVLNL